MIVVCPNTVVSKLVFDWIAGREVELRRRQRPCSCPGKLRAAHQRRGRRVDRRGQRTILVDSAQLESGEPLTADFKAAAAHEIEAFKARVPAAQPRRRRRQAHRRGPAARGDEHGRQEGQARRARSAASSRSSMLTEGWDANTVTHILGIRRFGSQLLCEQVVGRGLRRRSYAVNDDGRFEPEYAEVYGVPFAFIPSDRPVPKPQAAAAGVEVRALDERGELRDRVPEARRLPVELPDEQLYADFDDELADLHLDQELRRDSGSRPAASSARSTSTTSTRSAAPAPQQVAFAIAADAAAAASSPATTAATEAVAVPRSWSRSPSDWLDECVTIDPDATDRARCCSPSHGAAAAEKVVRADRPLARAAARERAAADHPPLRPGGLHRRRRASSPARS